MRAVSRLIECATARRSRRSSSYRRGRFDGVVEDVDDVVPTNALTPMHADYLRICHIAGQYRIASNFLMSRPLQYATLDSPILRLASYPTSSLMRAHYFAGLVHVGCENWDDALDSFSACLVVPNGVVGVGDIAVAARKKGLLVRCLLLESDELDGRTRDASPHTDDGVGGSGGRTAAAASSSSLEDRVFSLPGASSAAVVKLLSASSSNRAGRADPASAVAGGAGGNEDAPYPPSSSAPERTAGSETSERSTRRRARGTYDADVRASSGGERMGPPVVHAPTSSSTNSSAAKLDFRLGKYHELVSAYVRGNAHHYARVLNGMAGLLRSEGNWDLAKRLDGRLRVYRTIRNVSSVYSVVGADVLERKVRVACACGEVGRRRIEDVLMGMARCDAGVTLLVDPFVARMDQSTGMIAFPDDGCDDADGGRMEADLSSRLRSCIALAERVRELDIGLTTSPKYRQHAMREMTTKGERGSSITAKMMGSSVADIGHGPMDIGDW